MAAMPFLHKSFITFKVPSLRASTQRPTLRPTETTSPDQTCLPA